METLSRRYTVSTTPYPLAVAASMDPNSEIRTRSKTVSSGTDTNSIRSSSDAADRLLLRHIPGSSWFCCKFWKRKNSPPGITATGTDTTNSTIRSPSFSMASEFDTRHASTDGGRQRRPRGYSFYKNLVKRSRTVSGRGRSNSSSMGEHDGLISGEYAPNTEEEVDRLLTVIARLLEKLHDQPEDIPALGDEECVICATSRASMQTFPCGHKVLCKMCFIRTIEISLQERQLPLRCVVCRSRVVRLKQQSALCPVVILQQRDPPGSYSVTQTPSPLPPSGIRRPGYM